MFTKLAMHETGLYRYNIFTPGQAEIISYSGLATELTIPSMLGEAKVMRIGKNAFRKNRRLTRVVIPAGVESIGECAFEYCESLAAVRLPASLHDIGPAAFMVCTALREIALPAGLTGLGANAFGACTSLENIALPGSVKEIGSGAFAYCRGLTSVEIGDGAEVIGTSAFEGCEKLENVVLPIGVKAVGERAFRNCTDLQMITLPDSVTDMASSAFDHCSRLGRIHLSGGVPRLIDQEAWQDLTNRDHTYVTADEENPVLTMIGHVVCEKDGMRLVHYPFTDEARIVIPHGVKTVGPAFCCCSPETIVLPVSVSAIDSDAFSTCFRLRTFEIAPDHPVYEAIDGVLIEKRTKRLVCYPKGRNERRYAIPDGVTAIGDFAFAGCPMLSMIDMPGSVTEIGRHAFTACHQLMSAEMPDSVLHVDDSAFGSCSQLWNVKLSRNLTSIGEKAFAGCSSLREIDIPPSVTTIGRAAFAGLIDLTVTAARGSCAAAYCSGNGIRCTLSVSGG